MAADTARLQHRLPGFSMAQLNSLRLPESMTLSNGSLQHLISTAELQRLCDSQQLSGSADELRISRSRSARGSQPVRLP